jgi:hypothetical protein
MGSGVGRDACGERARKMRKARFSGLAFQRDVKFVLLILDNIPIILPAYLQEWEGGGVCLGQG